MKSFFKSNFYFSVVLGSYLFFSPYAAGSSNFVSFDKGKSIVFDAIVKNLEPVYNPCVSSRSVAPEGYSNLVFKVLEDTADMIGNNDGFSSPKEIKVALQYAIIRGLDLNKFYCPKGNGPAFENTENFKIVIDLYEKYKDVESVDILPWYIKMFLKFKYGI